MKELALHILDITQNSIRAGASMVELMIDEQIQSDTLMIQIVDNGCGIPADRLENITNPFVTTRSVRKVGLGLSLFKSAALGCDGTFDIQSVVGKGTTVSATFRYSHIDRAPLGNMPDTIMTMILSFNGADLIYTHRVNNREYHLDTRTIKSVLQCDGLLEDPEILNWIRDDVVEGLVELMEE